MMKIALFHNPRAGNAMLKPSKLIRQFENAGYDVLYASVKEENWEKTLTKPFDRAVIAGGDGTLSRLAPLLAGRTIPFCILPLGTANNCAKSLGQMHTVESIVSGLRSERIKKLDLGIVSSSGGHRIFIESVGIGLLAESMSEMRALEEKNKSKIRLSPEERLADALKNLRRMAKGYPEVECELFLDDEIVAGRFLLLELANMTFIGPNLQLFPSPDPSDGRLDVAWIEGEQRSQWREYLQLRRRGEHATAPVNSRRCRRVLFRYVDAPAHVDGKVFLTMATPVSIRLLSDALNLVDSAI
jgi:diacylglycerol kinase (ATP)